MTEVTKPVIAYGKGFPTATTAGTFYKDLLTDILYQKDSIGTWVVRDRQPAYSIYNSK